jgi:O-antigen/teichoic acid export membrane protein
MKHWFKDRHLRSLVKNSSYLAASKAVAGVAALATYAFAGRSLGLTAFGVLILIHSYAQAASGISKFQSWQLIVRFSGDLQGGGDPKRFKEAVGFAFALDVSSGLLGMVAAILLLPVLGRWFGVPPEYLVFAMVYCTLLPTMAAATPNGILRALDRFDLISWQGTASPIARAILAGIAWMLGAPFEVFLAIWFVSDMGGDLFLWFLAWRELKRRDLMSGIRPTLRPAGLVRPWAFAISVNLTSSLNTAMGPIARLIVGGLLGPAGAALYRVAATLANSAQKPADLLAKAFYPEVARLDLSTKKPWKLMVRGMLLCVPIGLVSILVVLVAGRWLLDALFGSEFTPAYPVLLVLMFGAVLTVLSFPLPSMLLALDRPNAALVSRAVALVVFFGTIAPSCEAWGVVGAGVAFVVSNAVWTLIMAVQLLVHYRRVRRT